MPLCVERRGGAVGLARGGQFEDGAHGGMPN
jgi:hypothetical protein